VITYFHVRRVVERNVLAYRRQWYLFASGFAEPFLYLLSIGIGVGHLVGEIDGVSYRAFVAPGMMAAATMNGAVFDTTFGFFHKLRYEHTYDAMLATPLVPRDVTIGEVTWALLRGAAYASAFLVAMLAFGLVHSWWAVLAVPAAVLIGFAFAGAGAAVTSYLRSWYDFDLINLALMPMFLFSGTFFPLERYPDWMATVVRSTPLYQGVALERALLLHRPDLTSLGHALYLAAVGAIGLAIATRRLARLLTA
jgi:lipooligosaccharide transport system permease protein